MKHCAVKYCSNYNSEGEKDDRSFYRFPLDTYNQLNWVRAIRRSRKDPSWQPKKHSVVCSLHFDEKDFYTTKKGYRKLHKSAIPVKRLDHSMASSENESTSKASENTAIDILSRQPDDCKNEFQHSFESTEDGIAESAEIPRKYIEFEYYDKMCIVCLASDCKIFPIEGKIREVFHALVNCNKSVAACWECFARLRCAARLQTMARTAETLLTRLHITNRKNVMEKLKSINRQDYNLTSKLELVATEIISIESEIVNIKEEPSDGDKYDNLRDDVMMPVVTSLHDIGHADDDIIDDKAENVDIKTEDCGVFVEFEHGLEKETKDPDLLIPIKKTVPKPALDMKRKKIKNRLHHWRELDKLLVAGFKITKFDQKEQMARFEKRKESVKYVASKLKCGSCYMSFKNDAAYGDHMLRHKKEYGEHQCAICKIRTPTRIQLKVHMKRHQEEYKCNKCEMVTNNRSAALVHLKMHSGTLLKCSLCCEEFKHRSTYLSHRRLKHVSEHVCEECGYTFLSEKGIFVHKTIAHKSATPALEGPHCSECDVTFVSQEAYNRHLGYSSKHSSDEQMIILRSRDGSKAQPKPCEPMRPVTCEVCGLVVVGPKSYAYHFRHMHPDKKAMQFPVKQLDNKYVCELCGRKFQYLSLLKDHVNVHSGQKSFCCDVCDKSFYTRNSLQQHSRLHMATPKPYQCEDCGKNFSNPGNMRRHQLIHTGLKPYKCSHCEKSFNSSSGMQLHTKHVHLNIPWPTRDRTASKKNGRKK